MVTAYAYSRWSSDKQTQGDSKRRQDTAAADYAAQDGLTLSTTTYTDAGISAFKGLNAAEGALRAFIDAVNAGQIAKGSVLIVESLDRLSRLPVTKALRLFQEIVDAGIEIVTLSDGQRYSTATIDANWTSLIMALSDMARPHAESKMKSDRIKASWANKRKTAKILTAICPPWLRASDDRQSWGVIKEQADKVQRVFELSLLHGAPKIAKMLNGEDGHPKVPALRGSVVKEKQADGTVKVIRNDTWCSSTVNHVLRNRAVLGYFTPKHDIERAGYYPPIIEMDLWTKSHGAVGSRKWKGGGPGGDLVTNLFKGICYCGVCRDNGNGPVKMKLVSSKPPHIYLRCNRAYSGAGCTAPGMAYAPINKRGLERFVLIWLTERPQLSLTERGEVGTGSAKLVIEGNLELKRGQLERLIELHRAGVRSVVFEVLALEREIDDLEAELKELTNTPLLSDIEQTNIDHIIELDKLTRAGVEDVTDLRRALRSTLQQVIQRIDFMGDLERREDGLDWRRVQVTLTEGGTHDVWYPLLPWGVNGTRGRVPDEVIEVEG